MTCFKDKDMIKYLIESTFLYKLIETPKFKSIYDPYSMSNINYYQNPIKSSSTSSTSPSVLYYTYPDPFTQIITSSDITIHYTEKTEDKEIMFISNIDKEYEFNLEVLDL